MTQPIAVSNELPCTDMLKHRLRHVLSWIMMSVVLSFSSTSCQQDNDIIALYLNSDQVHTQCIWDKAPHCAFTDLIEYNSRLYCCFREAKAHIPERIEDHGVIRLLESSDGEHWHDCGTIRESEYDLRDPKLSVTPDNRLMLMYGRYLKDTPEEPYPWTAVKFLTDDEIERGRINNSNIRNINIEDNPRLSNYWLWRIKWVDGTAYGVAYKTDQLPLLVKSTDGINYTIVTVLEAMGNEADIEPLPDGNMLMVMRAQSGNGFIGHSAPPYDSWTLQETNHLIHCPAIITADDDVFIAGRSTFGTALFFYKNNNIMPAVAIPSVGGDDAYPGIICRNNDELWITYYGASHNGISIFIATISLNELKN